MVEGPKIEQIQAVCAAAISGILDPAQRAAAEGLRAAIIQRIEAAGANGDREAREKWVGVLRQYVTDWKIPSSASIPAELERLPGEAAAAWMTRMYEAAGFGVGCGGLTDKGGG